MVTVKTETTLAAPMVQVWKILTDFSSYPKWNPLIIKVQGNLSLGSRIVLKVLLLRILFGENSRFSHLSFPVPGVIGACQEGHLEWSGGLPRILYGRHYFKLKASGNETYVLHCEEFSGILTWIIGKLILKKLTPSYDEINRALAKRIAESRDHLL